jgi:hypothetical protein
MLKYKCVHSHNHNCKTEADASPGRSHRGNGVEFADALGPRRRQQHIDLRECSCVLAAVRGGERRQESRDSSIRNGTKSACAA